MVGQNVILGTMVPTLPNQVTFSQFWDQVMESGIMGLGYGVVKPVLKGKLQDDYRYVVSPELSSTEGEPGALETLVQQLDHTIGKGGNGIVPYSYTSPQGNVNEPKGVWEVTLVLHYNPSSPSLYLMGANETLPLHVFNMKGIQVWNQLKNMFEYDDGPNPLTAFELSDSRLSEFVDTSVRNIYVLKRVNTHWDAINNRVVMNNR